MAIRIRNLPTGTVLNGPNLVWGIEAKAVDWTKWRPCLESGKPLVFDTWEAALDKMTEIELRDHTSSGDERNG